MSFINNLEVHLWKVVCHSILEESFLTYRAINSIPFNPKFIFNYVDNFFIIFKSLKVNYY